MKTERNYNSIEEFFKSDLFTESEQKALKEAEKSSQITDALIQLRKEAGLTQKELAEKLKVTQSYVSKLESGLDCDLKIGEIESYTRAIKKSINLHFGKEMGHADWVKYHVKSCKHHLESLLELSKGDLEIENGVHKFLAETAFNLFPILEEASKRGLGEEMGIKMRVQKEPVAEHFPDEKKRHSKNKSTHNKKGINAL